MQILPQPELDWMQIVQGKKKQQNNQPDKNTKQKKVWDWQIIPSKTSKTTSRYLLKKWYKFCFEAIELSLALLGDGLHHISSSSRDCPVSVFCCDSSVIQPKWGEKNIPPEMSGLQNGLPNLTG